MLEKLWQHFVSEVFETKSWKSCMKRLCLLRIKHFVIDLKRLLAPCLKKRNFHLCLQTIVLSLTLKIHSQRKFTFQLEGKHLQMNMRLQCRDRQRDIMEILFLDKILTLGDEQFRILNGIMKGGLKSF